MCLADFVAWFNYIKDEHAHCSTELLVTGLDDFVSETNFDDDTVDDPSGPDVTEHECEPNEYLVLKGGMKLQVRQKKPEIIQSVRYHKDKDLENHYREQVMLYTPWQNKSTDVINNCQTYQEQFEQIKDEILTNRCQYEYHSEIVDKAMNDVNNAEYDNFDNVAPNTEHIINKDCTIKNNPSELFGCFDPGKNKQHKQ